MNWIVVFILLLLFLFHFISWCALCCVFFCFEFVFWRHSVTFCFLLYFALTLAQIINLIVQFFMCSWAAINLNTQKKEGKMKLQTTKWSENNNNLYNYRVYDLKVKLCGLCPCLCHHSSCVRPPRSYIASAWNRIMRHQIEELHQILTSTVYFVYFCCCCYL